MDLYQKGHIPQACIKQISIKQSKDSNKQSKDSNSLKKETDNSINHYHDEKHVLRAYASPSIYDSSPAIKIFFKNIKEEIKYKKESQYLRDTLSLVQYKNSLAVLFKSDSKRDENSVYEESLLNDRMERMDSFRFDEGHDDESFTDMLSRKTTYSSGIYNILDLDSRFHSLDDIDIMEYIIDADRQNLLDERESLSKNYNPIDVNFRIKSSRNKEKYLGLIIEGQFDENGTLKNYMGFIKDNSSRFYYEKELKDSLRDMDALLNEVLDINSKLIAMSNSEEQLQENSYSFIMDLLDLFIKIMDSKLEKGCLKKDILQDIQLIINVLLLIHRHIASQWKITSIS